MNYQCDIEGFDVEDEMVDIQMTSDVNEENETEMYEEYLNEGGKTMPYYDPKYSFYLPESDQEYDIGKDIGIYSNPTKTEGAVTKRIEQASNAEFNSMVGKLNYQQRLFANQIWKLCEAECEEKHVFLTGGPGTGKTFLIQTIDIGMKKIFDRKKGPWTCDVVKVAFTGAACNVLGNGTGTIHSTFKIPINQSLDRHTPLHVEGLTKLRSELLHLKWLIIDEISLVGNKLFRFIHWRLQEIKHIYNKPFGGVNILACGDLSQLKL